MQQGRMILSIGTAAATLVAALVLTGLGGPAQAPAPPSEARSETTPTPDASSVPAPTPTPPTPNPAAESLLGQDACLLASRGAETVAAFRPEASLTPASTQKLLVSAVALDRLGPQHRFTTRVVAASPPEGGIVGDLWLVGSGDPMLATPERIDFLTSSPRWRELPPTPLAHLADALVAAGVREVRGGVHGDASRHGPIGYLDAWPARFIEGNDISPLSALAVDSGWLEWRSPRAPAPDPAAHAAAELTELLRARGVTVTEEPTAAVAPRGVAGGTLDAPARSGAVPIAHVQGAPLVDILTGILHSSHNEGTEMLLREIGTVATGRPGTTADGARAVADSLAAVGVHTQGLALADGSGLSPHNRVSCRTLVETLQTSFGGVQLPDLLPVAAQSGTLHHRYHDTPLQGLFQGKTGWIRGVVGIAGELEGPDPLTVVLIQNGVPSLQAGRGVEHDVLMRVAGG